MTIALSLVAAVALTGGTVVVGDGRVLAGATVLVEDLSLIHI